MIKNSFEDPHRRLNSGERGMKVRERLNSLNASDVVNSRDNPAMTHYAMNQKSTEASNGFPAIASSMNMQRKNGATLQIDIGIKNSGKLLDSDGIHIGGSLLNATDSQYSIRKNALNSAIRAVQSDTKEARSPDITQWMIKEMQR